MELQESHIPLYLKLYWKLKDDIHFMELSPGERMPTVEELHKTYGVSQGTVRKALELLKRDGLISKKRGLGVSVRHDLKIPTPDSIMTGEAYKSRILQFDHQLKSAGWIEATKKIRNLFSDQTDIFQNNQIYQIEALLTHKEDNRRKAYALGFIPAWIMSLVGEESIRRFASERLLRFNGIKTDRITVETRPWICNAEVGEILGVSEGSAIFRRLHTHYSADDRILAVVEHYPTVNASIREHKLEW